MKTLPKEVSKLINHYFNLKIDSKNIKTPYHMNVKHVRAELRGLVGKGTPQEMQEEVNIFAKLRNFNLEKASSKEIRQFMQKEGIGIDCSGLIAHILDTWLKAEKRGNLKSNIDFPKMSFFKRLAINIRPIENINADLLTNEKNTNPIDLKNVIVGDLLRLKGIKQGHHIAIITNVKDNEIEYTHSTKHYGEDNGIRIGKIRIKDKNKDLDQQEWLEKDGNGVCWTLKQYTKQKEDNGTRRLKFFEQN
jgi:hypothetical protein